MKRRDERDKFLFEKKKRKSSVAENNDGEDGEAEQKD